MEHRPKLFVMVGLPAAGKTTLARRIEAEHRALRFTPDEWMNPLFGDSMADGRRNVLEGRFIATALRSLQLGFDVVLDFGVWARDERTALRQWDRVTHRFSTAPESTFPISQSDLDGWRARFQPPGDDELGGAALDPPPDGFDSWRSWVVDWWPTALM